MKLGKKSILIGVMLLSVLIVSGLVIYRQQQQKAVEARIEKQVSSIQEQFEEFENQKERTDKLTLLVETLSEYEKYMDSDSKNDEVSKQYEIAIADMKNFFTDDYKKVVEDNTLSDIDTLTDKNIISENKANLETLIVTIESETGTVLSKDESQELIESIEKQIVTYSERIATIEAEKKAKAEQEAQAEAERLTAEKRAKTHYENDYFSIDVPEEWADQWSVTEQDITGSSSVPITLYMVSHSSGGAPIYVFDMRNSTKLPVNVSLPPMELIGYTSTLEFGVFKGTEAGAGFFSGGATITLK